MTITAFIVLVLIVLIVVAGGYLLLRPARQTGSASLYSDALALIIEGKKPEAIRLLKEVVKADTDHVQAYLHLGNLIRETNPAQATKIHQSIIVRPKLSKGLQIRIYEALAEDHLAGRDYKRALRDADQILSLDRHNLQALEFKLKIAELQSDWDEAFDLARAIQKVTRKKDSIILADFLVKKGDALYERDDRKGAESFYRKAIKQAPDYPLSYLKTGNLFEAGGKLEKAVDYWQAYAERAGQDSVLVYDRIESSLYELGRFSEIEDFYTGMIEAHRFDVHAMVKLANVLDAKGETARAMGVIEEALEENGDTLIPELMQIRLMIHDTPANRITNQIDRLIDKISVKS